MIISPFFQESPVIYEAAADCIIALLVRLEDHDNSPFMSALELNVFTTVRRLEVRIFLKKVWLKYFIPIFKNQL